MTTMKMTNGAVAEAEIEIEIETKTEIEKKRKKFQIHQSSTVYTMVLLIK